MPRQSINQMEHIFRYNILEKIYKKKNQLEDYKGH